MATFQGFIGGSYTTRSINFDCERSVNLYPVVGAPGTTKTVMSLDGTPGLKPFLLFAGSPVRQVFWQDGRGFAVAGGQFCEFFASRTYIVRGSVAVDANPATISSNGQAGHQLLITSGGLGYVFDLNDSTFVQVTSTGFPSPCTMAAFSDGYGIALKANSAQINLSNLDDFLTWNALDVAQVSQSSDNIVSLAVSHRELWLLGSKTTTPWADIGDSFPYAPIQGAFIEMGNLAPWSVAALDNTLFQLGGSQLGGAVVYKAQGYNFSRISTHALEYIFSTYPRLTDSIGYAYQEEGHLFYRLYIPSADVTWCYDVASGFWHEDALWDDHAIRWFPHPGRCHTFGFGKHLIGDRETGILYEQDLSLLDFTLVVP